VNQLGNHDTQHDFFDEVFTTNGKIRPQYQTFTQEMLALSPAEFQKMQHMAD